VALTALQTGDSSLVVRDGDEVIAEIRDLHLRNVRFRPGGRLLIGNEVPLPLFWEQYANHEDPERNAGSNGRLRIVHASPASVSVVCEGTTESSAVESVFETSFRSGGGDRRYEVEIRATMRIPEGRSWSVTPNPSHGEVEFCNIWPDGAFSSTMKKTMRYSACYVDRGTGVTKIPHHHLESQDKHNITLHTGDRMVWLLEDENLCVTLLSTGTVTAGICAYMWDAHLGYKACTDATAKALPAGSEYFAAYRLSALDAREGNRLMESSVLAAATELDATPVIVDGVHTFAETLWTVKRDPADVWPWETEVHTGDPGTVNFFVDRTRGWDDHASVCIDARRSAGAMWKATALGPAFRQQEFTAGERYRLSAYVNTELVSGAASLAIRVHRKGAPGVYDPTQYDVFRCSTGVTGTAGWTYLEVTTPPVRPVADRIHLLLEMHGSGKCWFDNVQFLRGL